MEMRQEQHFIYIPQSEDPDIPIVEGYYTRNEFANMLRRHKDEPGVTHFLADMLEE